MHYIIGTHFAITPQQRKMGARKPPAPLLPPGQTYQIVNIAPIEGGVAYTFIGVDRTQHRIEFNSCREADSFIASCRNEVLPTYNTTSSEL